MRNEIFIPVQFLLNYYKRELQLLEKRKMKIFFCGNLFQLNLHLWGCCWHHHRTTTTAPPLPHHYHHQHLPGPGSMKDYIVSVDLVGNKNKTAHGPSDMIDALKSVAEMKIITQAFCII